MFVTSSYHSQEWTLSSKFPLRPHQKYYYHTSLKNLALHRLLRWTMMILPILTTSRIHFSLRLVECIFLTKSLSPISDISWSLYRSGGHGRRQGLQSKLGNCAGISFFQSRPFIALTLGSRYNEYPLQSWDSRLVQFQMMSPAMKCRPLRFSPFTQVTYDLRFIQGMPDEKKNGNVRESLSALHVRVIRLLSLINAILFLELLAEKPQRFEPRPTRRLDPGSKHFEEGEFWTKVTHFKAKSRQIESLGLIQA